MIRNASAKAITEANSGSKTRASTCSPRAPIARLAPVTPSCIAAMKRVEPAAVVKDDLSRARGRVGDRLAVPRERKARRELDRPLEGVEVVAERIGARLGVEPDRRRDRGEQVVAGDEHAVALEADVPI